MSNNDWKKRLGVVFSTEKDFEYSQQEGDVTATPEPSQQVLKIYIDRKQRAGKEVTIVEGFVGSISDMELLAKQLKTKCGAGGGVKEGLILVQGDVRQKVKAELDKQKYRSRMI